MHQFNPHEAVTWWQTDLKMSHDLTLNGAWVRNMHFDLKTDFLGLKELIKLNSRQLRIYQFEKEIPETLVIEHLPENAKTSILQNNGLKHIYWINFEFLTISSFDPDFISSVSPE